MALNGTLKDFGIADILQLIGQQQKTGVLYVKNKQEEVEISFQNGQVIRSLARNRKDRELIGRMIVNAGLIAEDVLDEALETQKRTLKRIGDILVGDGRLSATQLQEMTQLQTTETIFKLFQWNAGTYEFIQQDVEVDVAHGVPIRSETLLMEGFRRIDEWPLIRKRVPSIEQTCARLKPLDPPAPVQPEDDGVDAAFDMVLANARVAVEVPKTIGDHERLFYSLAEPDVSIQYLCDVSRLGEFETCKAIYNLVEAGYLKTVTPPKKAKTIRTAAHARKPASPIAHGIAQQLNGPIVQLTAALVLFVALCIFGNRGKAPKAPVAVVHASVAGPMKVVADAQLARIASAIEMYRLSHGRPPDKLNDLVVEDILDSDELRYPFENPYFYKAMGDSYLLLPPLQ